MRAVCWAVVATLALSCSKSASATVWLHTKGEDNPFTGGAEQVAVAVEDSGFSLGFRCTTATDLAFMLVVPERPVLGNLAVLGATNVEMHVIVDDAEAVEMPASIAMTPDGENFRAEALGEPVSHLPRSVADAKRRVAVAVKWGDEILWTRAFNVRGSRRAIKPLISGCNIP